MSYLHQAIIKLILYKRWYDECTSITRICIIMAILVVTLICVNRAYTFKHTIDAKPQQPQQNNQVVE